MTYYHSKLFAHELTRRRASDEADRFALALANAQVDVNPHQVDAALFAFQNPLSGGALLADEVGLGKTIEAGLVMAQKWAEHRRRLLVIAPANLRKQWAAELEDKFFLPTQILETGTYNAAQKRGEHPLVADAVLICSYQFAARRAQELGGWGWDLVVMDEAHRLRNVYKTSNRMGSALKKAFAGQPKLLLTATPLQNSLLELYGLVSLLDEQVFGDLASFREQYATLKPASAAQLKARLRPLCHRTLRSQVTQYVNYTRRHVLVEEFTPHAAEQRLYEEVSAFLQREHLAALPARQRTLMTLILRKLLASSSYAIAGALQTIAGRVQGELQQLSGLDTLQDYEALQETAEEWDEEEDGELMTPAQRQQLGAEAAELERLAEDARAIRENAKASALLSGLDKAFAELQKQGAPRKAIIFTESRRTQDYLLSLLEERGYAGRVVLFNGTNNDPRSREIYKAWAAQYKGTERVSGSKTADMRSALVEEFRERADIMIATEAGAEGINLQFCALVVNYDLPWNPQRIEQRIGRAHRYGQKYDVVVLNFLNKGNEADQRVYELLSEKFKLFEGVFGSSDEVIGAVGSGVDFEKRVADIYQRCRSSAEIRAAFDELQASLSAEIDAAMQQTRTKLLENFDEDVHRLLKKRQSDSAEQLGDHERWLLGLTRAELGDAAQWQGERHFSLLTPPTPQVSAGDYALPARDDRLREGQTPAQTHRYRSTHPLAQHLIDQAVARSLPAAHLTFDYAGAGKHIGAVAKYKGESGYLTAALYQVDSLGQTEEHLLLYGLTDSGEVVDSDILRRMFQLPATVTPLTGAMPNLTGGLNTQREARLERIQARNLQSFNEAEAKIEAWSDDLKVGLERDIKELDRQIRELRRTAAAAPSLQAKLDAQKGLQALEKERTKKRRNLFEEQDRIDEKRAQLIDSLVAKLESKEELLPLFSVKWSVQ